MNFDIPGIVRGRLRAKGIDEPDGIAPPVGVAVRPTRDTGGVTTCPPPQPWTSGSTMARTRERGRDAKQINLRAELTFASTPLEEALSH